MITPIIISPDMLDTATQMANDMGRLSNSITSGAGNVAGFLGELMIQSVYPDITQSNTYDYDLVYGDITADVKTKRTTVTPKDHYDCSVAALNVTQGADYYIFCRVLNDYTRGWILGFLPKTEYYIKSRFMKKGDIDPDNGFIVKSDCYNVRISDLADISTFCM